MNRFLVLLVLVAWGCGGSSSTPSEGRYLELREGLSWIYKVTDNGNGSVHSKTNIVGPMEDVGGRFAGTLAYRVRTETLDGVNVSWQQDTGSAIQRLRDATYDADGILTEDQYYEPYKLHMEDTHGTQGETWTQHYTEYAHKVAKDKDTTTVRADQWTIDAVDEEVEVPAGTFHCLRIHRVSLETTSDKMYWYARGIGKIKEISDGQTEELVSRTEPP